ncbi:DNA helicase RecQ [Alphaproteobacteria bacterium]|nr:DNA helicase RecQ [Alphaproteobacteria bacterium]
MTNSKLDVLNRTFGFSRFRPGQEEPIDALLAGKDVFCVMPTGAGKSLIYQVPALVASGLTIVISPLIALMQDQVDALKLVGVNAEALNSSRDYQENLAIWSSAKAGKTRLLYMAPERLMSDGMLDRLKTMNISLIAIDEAHCISQWGPSFRPEYALLTDLKTHFPSVPVLALTASADEATRHDIANKLYTGDVETFVAGFDRPNISLAVEPKVNWKSQLSAFVTKFPDESGIVYCTSRKQTEEAANFLVNEGHKALPYHAGLPSDVRGNHQTRFVREPGLIMTATIAFGMGIDKPDVRFVFHTGLASSMEAYYQEFGRAGRDGELAAAHMLYGLDDIRLRRHFIESDGRQEIDKRREHKRLDALIAFCESPTCRRQSLLAYFGDDSGPCKNCDICLNPVELVEGTREGQMVLSAIARTGQRFGPAHIIDVLLGAKTARLLQLGHDKLVTYGVGSEHVKPQWQSIIRQLIATGFVHLDIAQYGGLSITDKGRQLLKGEAEFKYRAESLKPVAGSKRAKSVRAEQSMSQGDSALYERLKGLRSELAKAKNVPAYVILHDRTLRQIATDRPETRIELSKIHGMGEAKLEKFGEVIIELTSGF